ncbi:MFS transporter [Amycolatopsis acidiphila]|uniref:MFS transporter n=1 Tax=Amycolatopsis acidiphila TaxID=715473 RepID=A0A558A8P1_9PSEU|nr:MFS transporter [Amycolatopsis acidiphila]TVT20630.1 MFS transporter [Amycolatopsis acidiphila]UIJ61372.1 MFS transporter [Amycolatopsis acidiphila]GHG77991.1 MFS transporter [Amycolatopsis acidiphila]
MSVPTSPTVDVFPIIERQRVGRFWLGLFAVSWAITFLDGFDLQILSFAGRYIKSAYHLSDTQLGTLGTVGLFGTLIGGLCLGYLGDRVGRRPSIMVATIGFGIFMIAFVFAQDYTQLVVLRFVSGLFLGGVLPLAWALNTEFAPARFRSTSVVIIMVGYSLGSAAGGPVSNVLIPRFGWESVFVAGGICSLLAVIPVVFVLPESVKFLAQKDLKQHRIAKILRRIDPSLHFAEGTRFVAGIVDKGRFTPAQLFRNRLATITTLLWIAYICSSAVVFYLAFWGPILNERLGFSTTAAATIAACTSVAGAGGQLLIGRFIDRKGAGTIALMPLFGVPCLLLIGLAPLGKPAYILVLLVANIFIIGGHGGMHSIAGIFYRPAIRANGAAWATSIAKFGAMLGPWLAGVIMDGGLGAQGTFYVFALFPLLMSGLLFALGRAQKRLPHDADGAPAPVSAAAGATRSEEAVA